MAMFDLSLLLAENKEIKSAFTSDAIDFRQPRPTTGASANPFYVVIAATEQGAGTGTVAFTLQDSADGSSDWQDVASVSVAPAALVPASTAAFAMPITHRRYVRFKIAPASGASITAGKVTAYINEGFELMPREKREGVEWYKSVD